MQASDAIHTGHATWRWAMITLVAVPAALLALTHCKGDDETAVVDAGPTPPAMSHGPPNEAAGQMCVVCHSCGNDGTSPIPAPLIDNSSHDPCTFCHEPDGSVVFHGDGCSRRVEGCKSDSRKPGSAQPAGRSSLETDYAILRPHDASNLW